MAMYDILKSFSLILLIWNCKSLLSNAIEFKNLIGKTKPDVICLTETWFLVTSKFKLNGYVIYRNDRFGARGGGVAILIKSEIRIKRVNFTNNYQDRLIESLIVEVVIDKA